MGQAEEAQYSKLPWEVRNRSPWRHAIQSLSLECTAGIWRSRTLGPFYPVVLDSLRSWLDLRQDVQDCPLGGKLESCCCPDLVKRTYLKVFKDVHCPFHSLNSSTLCASIISGIQNPLSYSLASTAIRCLIISSLALDGRPGLRSIFSFSNSSTSRCRYLINNQKRVL